MNALIIILAYVLVICEVFWYFTCTKHEDIPLILVLIAIIIGLIPGMNVFAVILFPILFEILKADNLIKLKDNWFNRKFLSYRE